MMIKANGEYLDFDGDIEIENRIKLFEAIDESAGDFSYTIPLPNTAKNRKLLGIPLADSVKSIYQNVPSEVINNSGEIVNTGKLQITSISPQEIESTFYAGNTDWFSQLSNPLSDLPLYRYDTEITESNILSSFSNTDGITFPIIDTGALITRQFSNLKIEDFTGCFYVKTLFHEIFSPLGIKLQGELFNDTTYSKLVVATNNRSQDQVNNRSIYVSKEIPQSVTVLGFVQFENTSTFPYFVGSVNNLFTASNLLPPFTGYPDTYTPDVRIRVKVDINLNVTGGAYVVSLPGINLTGTSPQFSWSTTLNLDALQIMRVSVSTGGGAVSVNSGSLKVTPIFIYKAFGVSSVPDWSQGQFVSNIFRIFNVLPSYNSTSKTLNVNLFNKIKEQEYIDVSDQIVVESVDFSEVVQDYGRNNYFKYQDSEDEDLRQYNISNFIKYGSGNITVDNDFIDNEVEVVESDFTSPITYLNGIFDMSMERINFVELEEIDDTDLSSVTNSGGTPRFNYGTDIFDVGDLVRIESNVESYNGDWVIASNGAGYITVNGPTYESTATGTITLLEHKFTTDDNVYLFVNVPSILNTDFSSNSSMLLESATSFTESALAYFNLLSNNRAINRVYKQSLSFGTVNNPLSYQKTIIETYWPIVSKILNDPVLLKTIGYLDKVTYDQLVTFLRPLMVKTNETTNLYYINRITGYKSGHEPCDVELIKL